MLSHFAETIFKRTYAFTPDETWEQCAARVAKFVADGDGKLEEEFFWAISNRKFMPGGRYLYSAGRELPQLTNCFLKKAEDSREGWGTLLDTHVRALSTGGGVGTNYSNIRPKGTPIGRYGGIASGPISLMQMVNEVARHVMAGGKRRSALWAGLNWAHPDVPDFIKLKNWSTDVKALKERDFSYPAPLDMTNISVCLDDAFFKSVTTNSDTKKLYYSIVKSMCKTGEPAFSVDIGKNKDSTLRNPCCLRGSMMLSTPNGLVPIKDINVSDTVWTGKAWTKVLHKWNQGVKPVYRYETNVGYFEGTDDHRVLVAGEKTAIKETTKIDYATGEDSKLEELNPQDIIDGVVLGDGYYDKEAKKVMLCIGLKDTDYFQSEIAELILKQRHKIRRTWHTATTIAGEELPYTYERDVPARFLFGDKRKIKGFLRGLFSANGSNNGKQISLKQTSYLLVRNVQILLSHLGIKSTVTVSNHGRFVKHTNGTYWNRKSYKVTISGDRAKFLNLIGFIQKYKHNYIEGTKSFNWNSHKITHTQYLGQEEVFDIMVEDPSHVFWTNGLLVSNCEVVSDKDGDCCNLGSVVLPRIEDINELKKVTRIGVRFLYRATFKGWLPHEDFENIRQKYRRIGLGLMGLHDWCLKNHLPYEPSGELGKWLSCWANISDDEADRCAKVYNDVRPIACRAVAPTGTIGIICETSTGIEPLFCTAYKRRFLGNDGKMQYSYVIDPTAERAITEYGVNPEDIEDAYSLSTQVERRLAMQAFVQDFTDQAISSTINLPEWGEIGNNNAKAFAETLLRYLPRLRGITCYPEGARPGQPITPIRYETAKKHTDAVFEENEERCSGNVCGI